MEMTIEAGKDTLMNYIMKNCLWQFNSRGWDRKSQNENIIGKATQILCKEETSRETLADRCYWAEAQELVNEWQCFPWLQKMNDNDIKAMMGKLKETLDYQLITNSLNEELKNPNY
ncbi:nitrogenase delta subunit [Pectinatus haikarae]|uniref:Nitrogenase iron-iron protein delta chain n=2 Tax=Pectinatus haikarae TaxID=349096 RepID=A0ABT9YAN7_9FIRM|nr:nitrogenase delta subunit [Pectinatus haikarae]